MTKLLAFLAGSGLCCLAWAAPFDPEYWIAVSASVVKIEVSRPVGYSLGTGVVVGPGRVVTACHVLRDGKAFAVLHGGVRHEAVARMTSTERDVCVLQAASLEAPPVTLRPTSELAIGEEVGAIGFSAGAAIHYAHGAVDRLHRYDRSVVVQTSAAFTSGASGGGLFDAAGRLVGILMFRMRGPGAQFFSAPVEWIGAGDEAEPGSAELWRPPFWDPLPGTLPYFMRANALASEERWDELRSLLSDWERDEPSSAEPPYLSGELDTRDGRMALALGEFREAVTRDPEHALAWEALVTASMHAGEVGLARLAYGRLVMLSAVLSGRVAEAFPEVVE